MALLPSASVVWADPSIPGAPPSRTTGLAATRSAFNRRSFGTTDLDTDSAADDFQDVTPLTGPAPVPVLIPSLVIESKLNVGEDWFEKIHIYPQGTVLNPGFLQDRKIQFGQILAQQDQEYEIYNAFRKSTATLTGITKSAVSPGIETPNVAVLDTVGPQTALLGPGTTFNVDLTTGLGTPVRVNLRALQDGLSRFDGPVTFTFDIASTELTTSGARIAIITSNYDFPYSEDMEFLTDIIPATGGKEQRLSVRKQDRERYNTIFRLDGVERQRMNALLFDWHYQGFGLPLFHEAVQMTAASLVGANQFQIAGGDATDFRVGGLALVITDEFTFDVVEISAVTDTLLTITGTAVNAYPAGTDIAPVRTCRIVSQLRTILHKFNDLEEFRIVFESTDNDTGRAPASSTAFISSTYLGKILLDDCNIVGLTMTTAMDRNITVLDNKTGAVSQNSPWDRDKRGSSKGFLAQGKQAIQDLKALIRSVRGRQVSFYLPTFTNDLTAGSTLVFSANIIDIENIDYTRFVRDRDPMATFRITFTDGTSLVRVITASNDHPTDPTLERLTLDTTWPVSRPVSDIERIQFYELVRFNTDRFRIIYDRVGLARLTAPVKVVFDV